MEINKNLNIVNNGLNQDASKEFQPKGTYPFALNAIPETNIGEQGSLSNELGNSLCDSLPPNHVPIGQIQILNDKTIIFSTTTDGSESTIGVFQNCEYTILINSTCLAFDITKQIRGIFRVREGCNTNIYFTDNINPWRVIDIDNLGQYLIDQDPANGTVTQRVLAANNSGTGWDCNSFKLFRDYDQTDIDMEVFNTGGQTNVGMYQFTFQYLDDDFNPQPWITPSNPIPIVKDSLNEYTGLDGDVTGTVTNKSIQITIDNLDTRYTYVRLGLIVSDFGTGFNSNAYILEEVPIEDSLITYLFQGIDPNKTQNTDLESFTFLPPDYYTGKDLTQIDNSLVLAYPRARDIDWTPFIQAALEIQSTYYIRDLFAEQTGQESFGNRYPNSYYYNKSLMRDEVYAFGIVYIFEDGTESPAFHIPGRAANTYMGSGTSPVSFQPGDNIVSVNYDNIALSSYNLHNRPPAGATYTIDKGGEWDLAVYDATNADNIAPNIIDSSQIENGGVARWKIFNTAIRTNLDTSTSNYVATGELAYFESQDYSYPETVDCNGDYIYPAGFRGEKVRYHKMPDATLEPHYWGYSTTSNPHTDGFAYIRPLNLKFDNISLPHSDVVGYRIVRVERNAFNSSVVDKGILLQDMVYEGTGSNSGFEGRTQGFPFNRKLDGLGDTVPTLSEMGEVDTSSGFQEKSFHSPRTKILKDAVSGDYVKFERNIWANDTTRYVVTGDENTDTMSRIYYDEEADTYFQLSNQEVVRYGLSTRYNDNYIPKSDTTVNYTNRVINKQGYIPAHAIVLDATEFPYYNSCQTETYALDLNENVPSSILGTSTVADWSTVGLGFPFTTQFTYEDYEWTRLENETVGFKNGAYYTSLKRYLPNQYNGIHQLIYSCPGKIDTATSYLYNNGDCFISDWAFKKYGEFYPDGNGWGANIDINSGGRGHEDMTRLTMRSIIRFWCESSINMELRDGTSERENSYYPNTGGTAIGDAGDEFNLSKWYYPRYYNEASGNIDGFLIPESEWNDSRVGTVRNWYSYNKDFSIENTVRSFFPLPINYDYCNECLTKFPHRVANSNKAYQEERADNYRIFLPNNYRDIPGETGSINELFIKDNKLFIHTTQSLWYQQVKPQQIKTDQATLYVGTGEFWEIPPNEIITSLNGYAGCQHQVGTINTPFGYFFPSERERKVFMFGGFSKTGPVLTEISNMGLRNWFENNLPLNLSAQYSTVPTDNPANPSGIGFTVAYDKRHRRIIFSKKDYKKIGDTDIAYFPDTNIWALNTGSEVIPVDLNNPTYFENKSWTISYQPDTESWISWHSYLPSFMYNDQNNFYTFSNQILPDGTELDLRVAYKHNSGNFQNYYTADYPYILELVALQSPLITNLFDNINYYNKVYSYDSTNDQWIEQPLATYDKLICYNDNQATPELDIVLTNNTPFRSVQPVTVNQIFVTKAEQDWNISGFIDYTNDVNESIFTNDWGTLQNQYYIDKVINTNKIDTTQSPFGLQQFRGKWMAYRLIADNANNYKYVSKYNTTLTRTSDR